MPAGVESRAAASPPLRRSPYVVVFLISDPIHPTQTDPYIRQAYGPVCYKGTAMITPTPQGRNPLHGITLEAMVNELVASFGWEKLGQRIPIRCFNSDPSVASSLKFLRRTPWARAKVEGLYLVMRRARARRERRAKPNA